MDGRADDPIHREVVSDSSVQARSVDRAILRAARDGERLVARVRLAVAAGVWTLWPVAHVASGEPFGTSELAVLSIMAIAAGMSWLSLRWLRERTPGVAFSMLSVTCDVALAVAVVGSSALWHRADYRGVIVMSSMPTFYLVVAAAGVRFSRRATALGIALGWLGCALLVAVDASYGRQPLAGTTPGNLLGAGFNLAAASLVGWSVVERTRKLADESTSLAIMAVRAAARLGAYVPQAVAEASLGQDRLLRGGRRVKLTVLFARLAQLPGDDASTPSERLTDLNDYLAEMADAIQGYGGVIDKYLGDGIMAVFGAPEPLPDAAVRALAAAEAMDEALERLNRRRVGRHLPPLAHAIGAHFGEAVAGNIGTPRRVQYTVVGDAVNVAARVQSEARLRGESVLCSAAAAEAARATSETPLSLHAVGPVSLRGRQQAVELYKLTRHSGPSLPPSRPTAASASNPPPASALARDAWARASQQSKQVLAAAPEHIVDAVLDTAGVTGERLVAWTRLAIAVGGIAFAPYFADPSNRGPLSMLLRVIGAVALASSLVILWRLRGGRPPSAGWTLVVVTLDVVLAAAVVALWVTWHSPGYAGVVYVPAIGLMHVVMLMAGIRLRRLHALCAASLTHILVAVMVWVDAARGKLAHATDVVAAFLILFGSAALAYAIASRTRRLLEGTIRTAREAAHARARLGAYVSEEVASQALSEEALELGGRALERVAVLSCDLRGFTSYAEGKEPEDLVEELNAYFEAMEEPIRAERGVIDSFVGDALLVVFGAPEPRPGVVRSALRAAVGMRAALTEHNRARSRSGLPPLAHGIGIHVGPVVAGHIGTPDRAAFTVVGEVVGIAEALEQATKHREHDVLISEDAQHAAIGEDDGGTLPETATAPEVELGAGRHLRARSML